MAGRKFETLDGLRGIAAMAVVLYHLPGPMHRAAEGGYLAVDLFFLMSGFVVAAAYEARLREGWSAVDFMLVRLKRLWPLYALGVALGVACFVSIRLLGPGASFAFPAMSIFQAALLSLFFVPQIVAYGGPAFPFNSASWSLSVELAGNLVYALAIRALSARVLLVLTAIGFLGLIVLAARTGSLDAGVSPGNIAGGYVRFLFSFPLGLLLHRLNRAQRLPVLSRKAWLPLALAAAALTGFAPSGAVRDVLTVTVVFPAIVVMSLSNATSPRVAKAFAWAGAVSYALYILHPPLIQLASVLWRAQALAVSLCVVVAVVALAALAERAFDRPLQARLNRLAQPVPRKRIGIERGTG